MTTITIRDGNNNPQTAAISTASAAGNPQIAVAEALPSGTNTIGAVNLAVLGQALATASAPVVLPAAQITALTPLPSVGLNAGTNAIGAITNTVFGATQSGTWTLQPGNIANTTPWLVKLGDGTNTVGLLNLTNSKAIPTAIVDGNGNQITSFGSGTQYADGTTQATPTGTALLWNDAGTVRIPSAAKPLPVSNGAFINAAVQTELALTAIGSTSLRSLGTVGYSKFSYQVDVSAIGTNVVIRLEGSNNGTTWANLSGDQTITANGAYLYSLPAVMCASIRLTLVSLSGGSPNVLATLLRGN